MQLNKNNTNLKKIQSSNPERSSSNQLVNGLPKLTIYPKCNFSDFRRKAETYIPERFGAMGQFIRTFEKYSIPTPTRPMTQDDYDNLAAIRLQEIIEQTERIENDPNIEEEILLPLKAEDFDITPDEETANFIFKERIKLREKQLIDITNKEPELFNLLLGKLSEESLQRISEYEIWNETLQQMNPYNLWRLIYTSHMTKNSDNDEINKETAEQKLNSARMKENQTIHNFKRYFRAEGRR